MATRLFFFLVFSVLCLSAGAAGPGPGFGVVQSIARLPGSGAEPSASAGASAAPKSSRRAPRYLVRLKMDDGTYQVREIRGRNVRIGQRALVTNAGDVVPE